MMVKLDLNRDFNINGVQYNAGKDVEVHKDHVQAIKDIEGDAKSAADYASTHHGAVPAPAYATEPTAQTPTRPLGFPELRQAQTAVATVETGEVVAVQDDEDKTEVPVDSEKAEEKEAK